MISEQSYGINLNLPFTLDLISAIHQTRIKKQNLTLSHLLQLPLPPASVFFFALVSSSAASSSAASSTSFVSSTSVCFFCLFWFCFLCFTSTSFASFLIFVASLLHCCFFFFAAASSCCCFFIEATAHCGTHLLASKWPLMHFSCYSRSSGADEIEIVFFMCFDTKSTPSSYHYC